MNIIILGSAGFLGRELLAYFKNSVSINRSDCDLLNQDSIKNFANKYLNLETVLINCAGKSWYNNSLDVYADNIAMYSNLSKYFNRCFKIFLFSSGAEYGRAVSNAPDINSNPLRYNEENYYGMSKAFITNDCRRFNNVFNLRIFGCFGQTEPNKKFIKANVLKYMRKEKMIIDIDRTFDYFFAEDIYKVLKYLIDKDISYREMNLTYEKKIKLHQISKFINSFEDHKVDINCLNTGSDYTGESQVLQSMPIEFVGLFEGIKKCYSSWRNKK